MEELHATFRYCVLLEFSEETGICETEDGAEEEEGDKSRKSHECGIPHVLPVPVGGEEDPHDAECEERDTEGQLCNGGKTDADTRKEYCLPQWGTQEEEETEEEEEECRNFPKDGLSRVYEGRECDEEECCKSGSRTVSDTQGICVCAEGCEEEEECHRKACSCYRETEELHGEGNRPEECWPYCEDVGELPGFPEDWQDVTMSFCDISCDNHEEAVVTPCGRERTELSENEEQHECCKT